MLIDGFIDISWSFIFSIRYFLFFFVKYLPVSCFSKYFASYLFVSYIDYLNKNVGKFAATRMVVESIDIKTDGQSLHFCLH